MSKARDLSVGKAANLVSTDQATIDGLTVGQGAGNVATNTAVGKDALALNTTGSINTAFGVNALYSNTTGQQNTSAGVSSMYNNTSGSYNTAYGRDALSANTTASYNTAVGYQAGYSQTTADYNTFIGYYAGRSTTGDQNTFVGKFAGNAITTGSLNTIIGAYNGNQGGLDIRTASNYIVLSDGGGTPRGYFDDSGDFLIGKAIGTGDTGIDFEAANDAIRPVNASTGAARDNVIDLGRPDVRFNDAYITNGVTTGSDGNSKQDIEELTEAEIRVARSCKTLLRKWRWKDAVEEKGDDARIHIGIIAQDLKSAFEAQGLDAGRYGMFISYDWVDEKTGEQRTRLGVRYHELLAFILAAL